MEGGCLGTQQSTCNRTQINEGWKKKNSTSDISYRTDDPLVTVAADDLMPLPPPLDQTGEESSLSTSIRRPEEEL